MTALSSTRPRPSRVSSAALTAVVALLAAGSLTSHAQAAEVRMSASATGAATWRAAGNWSTRTVPTIHDDLIFDYSNSTTVVSMALHTAPNDTFVARSLTFGSASGPALEAFSLLNGNSGQTPRTLTLATGAITVATQVKGPQSILSNHGVMTLVAADASFEINNLSAQPLGIQANLSDEAAGTSLTLGGTGLISLDRPNTFAGTTTLLSGAHVRLGHPAALGASASVAIAPGAALDLANTSDTAIAGLNDHNGGGGVVTRSAASAARTLVLNGPGTYSFGGVLQTHGTAHNRNFQLRIEGGGTHRFSGASTHGGTTTVLDGTLVVANTIGSATGSGAVNLGPKGRLAGNGVITGTVNTDPGGGTARVTPGENGPGVLTLGGLNFGDSGQGALFTFALGTESSRIHVTGNIRGTPTDGSLVLDFTEAGVIAPGRPYTLVTWEGTALNLSPGKFVLGDDSTAAGYVLDRNYGRGGWRLDQSGKALSVRFSATPTR